MFDSTRYRYFLKPQKMSQLKTQFYRLTCTRHGDQQHLTKNQLLHFLFRQGLNINLSNLQYFGRELFKQDNKMLYNYKQAIIMVDRLSINPQIQKEYRKVFKIFDDKNKDKITPLQLKKVMNRCNSKVFDDRQIQQIFRELDIDQDGLVSYEDFLCSMIWK